ncbi:hypothetical protein LF1_45360 [Rubripirellula obstinata]|uniref:Uncharacterized protein n=1 Tax=Rubripirellula obstinata TaxID=406547 RepID=A0A5B1CPT1_9BACT|nr:hypothetical protein [Rubripirellula obstinata]KAA1261975.1 hypothetical protein LF1_45360 [Rubripirellula obstinata]
MSSRDSEFQTGRLTDCENRFQRDFVEFSRLWSDTKTDWADARRSQFEREHLSSLGPSLSRLTAALHEFTSVIDLANRQLSDPHCQWSDR